MSLHRSLPLRPPVAAAFSGVQIRAFSARAPARPFALAGILALHAVLVWGLLQSRAVQQVLAQAQPLVVMLLVDSAPPDARSARSALPVPQPISRPSQVRPPPAPERSQAATAALPAALMPESSTASPAWPPAATVPADPAAPRVAVAPAVLPQPVSQPAPVDAPRQQLPASAIQFSEPPAVVYPRMSRRNGESGRVIVRAFVDASGGAPRSVQLAQSCGHPRLDEAALAAVQKARFKPTVLDGQALAGWALIPIDFELEAAR